MFFTIFLNARNSSPYNVQAETNKESVLSQEHIVYEARYTIALASSSQVVVTLSQEVVSV